MLDKVHCYLCWRISSLSSGSRGDQRNGVQSFTKALGNNAAWIDGKGTTVQVRPAGVGDPGPGEILIRNRAVALNPELPLMQETGIYVKKWPTIFGEDVAGEVVKVGEGVVAFTEGQRVLGYPLAIATRNLHEAAFQQYTILRAVGTALLPHNISFEEAAVIPLGLATASYGLYRKGFLGLPLPSQSPIQTGKKLIVWGGSSSVGSSVIQLATASGVEVIAIASPRNFDYCKKLGARQVFDYNSPEIISELSNAIKGGKLVGAFDAISNQDSILNLARVLADHGGGNIAIVHPTKAPISATVELKQVYAPAALIEHDYIAKAIFHDFLPKALASGQFVPAPRPQVVGQGLHDIQKAIDMVKKGVSAAKIVVSLRS